LPEKFPHPSTCWRRLRDWDEQGVWLNIWRAFLSYLTSLEAKKPSNGKVHKRYTEAGSAAND
jgi:hypothetical protein